METVELLVVGGRPDGTPAAMELTRAGRSVMLAESGSGLGGTVSSKGAFLQDIPRVSLEAFRPPADIRESGRRSTSSSRPRRRAS